MGKYPAIPVSAAAMASSSPSPPTARSRRARFCRSNATGSGNGGNAEVSSKGVLVYGGLVNLTAPHCATGMLLLDPENVTISTGSDTGGFTASSDNSVINVNTLETARQTANVTVSTGASGSQTGDITVAAPLTRSANTLTLGAYHSVGPERRDQRHATHHRHIFKRSRSHVGQRPGTFASTAPRGNHFVYTYAASLTPTLSGSVTKTYGLGERRFDQPGNSLVHDWQ